LELLCLVVRTDQKKEAGKISEAKKKEGKWQVQDLDCWKMERMIRGH
jgi:hypothetical protein